MVLALPSHQPPAVNHNPHMAGHMGGGIVYCWGLTSEGFLSTNLNVQFASEYSDLQAISVEDTLQELRADSSLTHVSMISGQWNMSFFFGVG